MTPLVRDALERILWTAIQAGLAVVAVDQLGLPAWAVLPVAVALAAAKTFVASRIGDRESAAMLRPVGAAITDPPPSW